MRSHGWSGDTPTSDEEAINRILDAVDCLTAEQGPAIRISDLARVLGVSRQTVYRYFPGTEALQLASRMRATDGFFNRMADHMKGWTNPAAAIVEGVAFAAEELASDQQMARVLNARTPNGHFASITTEATFTVGRRMFQNYDVDWACHGFTDEAIDELIEISTRTLHSILIDPGETPRDGIALRRFIARWLGPAVLYPQLVQGITALDAITDYGPQPAVSLRLS